MQLFRDTFHEMPLMESSLPAALATGPLRQATGPLWSGAGVGIGILKGRGLWFLGFGISKNHKSDRPKKQRFHADPKLGKMVNNCSRNIFDSVSLIYKLLLRFTEIPPSYFGVCY